MAVFLPLMLAAIQAFAGNAANFMDRTLEWPWYAFWVHAFHGSVDPNKVVAGPQYEVVKRLRTNDGTYKLKKKFPDFVLHYLDGFPLDHRIDNLHQVTNREELLQFYMGRFALTKSFLLAVCEIKALPEINAIPAGDSFQAVLARKTNNAQMEAQVGAQSQAGLYLAAKRDIGCVVAIAAVGPNFSWIVFTRDTVTDVSSNEDPTYVDPGPDVDDSDSSFDGPPSARAARAARRATAATAAADPPAPGPSERPKRTPHLVRKYPAHRAIPENYLKPEPTVSNQDNEGPLAGNAAGKGVVANKGNTTEKGKATARGKAVGKGTALNRPGTQKIGKAQAKKNKGKRPAHAGPMSALPLLSLPPFLERTVEQEEEATASAGPVAGSSTLVDHRTEGRTSADAGYNSDGSDDNQVQATNIPPEELQWSEWYNWASTEGIQERAILLNAMQRQYPNCPFIINN